MTYEQAKAVRDSIEAEGREIAKVMNSFPKGNMNLTPDSVKATEEWKNAKAASNAIFQKIRAFNTTFVKMYAKEIKAERAAKFSV